MIGATHTRDGETFFQLEGSGVKAWRGGGVQNSQSPPPPQHDDRSGRQDSHTTKHPTAQSSRDCATEKV